MRAEDTAAKEAPADTAAEDTAAKEAPADTAEEPARRRRRKRATQRLCPTSEATAILCAKSKAAPAAKQEAAEPPPRPLVILRRRKIQSAPPAPEVRQVRRLMPRKRPREASPHRTAADRQLVPSPIGEVQLRAFESNLAYIEVCSVSGAEMGDHMEMRVDTWDTSSDRMEITFKEKYGDKYRTVYSIWMDCRLFQGKIGPPSHSGEHCDAVTCIAEHYNFPKWLKCFRDDYVDCLRDVQDGDTLKVVCISHDCTYTSVACARIISYILCHKAKEPIHMQLKAWGKRGVCDGLCEDCNAYPCNASKQRALANAERMWKALFK